MNISNIFRTKYWQELGVLVVVSIFHTKFLDCTWSTLQLSCLTTLYLTMEGQCSLFEGNNSSWRKLKKWLQSNINYQDNKSDRDGKHAMTEDQGYTWYLVHFSHISILSNLYTYYNICNTINYYLAISIHYRIH